MEFHERLAEAFRVSGKSRSRLADEIGVTPAAISHWLLGRVRALKGESAARIEAATGVRASWLVTGEGPKLRDDMPAAPDEVLPDLHRIPLLSATQLKRWPKDAVALRQQAPFVLSESILSAESFAFQIDDLAMSPTFSPGDRVLCDPAIPPAPGDFVIARVKDAGHPQPIIFRRYRLHAPSPHPAKAHFSLMASNSDHPSFDSRHSKLSIMATMIEHRRYRASASLELVPHRADFNTAG